jgi:hypothetical protein
VQQSHQRLRRPLGRISLSWEAAPSLGLASAAAPVHLFAELNRHRASR